MRELNKAEIIAIQNKLNSIDKDNLALLCFDTLRDFADCVNSEWGINNDEADWIDRQIGEFE